MKKLFAIAILATSALLTSCSTNQNTARKKIQKHIFKTAHDAKSYEFIEMGKPDTIKKSDLLLDEYRFKEKLFEIDSQQVEFYKDKYDWYSERIKGSYGYIYKDSYLRIKKEYESRLEQIIELGEEMASLLSSIDKLLKSNEDTIEQIVYTCHYRIRIPMGGLIKTQSSIIYYPNEKDEEKWGRVSID
jgi:hypothetical protein